MARPKRRPRPHPGHSDRRAHSVGTYRQRRGRGGLDANQLDSHMTTRPRRYITKIRVACSPPSSEFRVMSTSPRNRGRTLSPLRRSGGRPQEFKPSPPAGSSRPDAIAASTVSDAPLASMRHVLSWPENTLQNSRQMQTWHWRPRSSTIPSPTTSCASCSHAVIRRAHPMRRSRSRCARCRAHHRRQRAHVSHVALRRFAARHACTSRDPRRTQPVCRAVAL